LGDRAQVDHLDVDAIFRQVAGYRDSVAHLPSADSSAPTAASYASATPDLGSLTLRENWDAVTEGNPSIGIARRKGDGTTAGGNGFGLATRPTASTEPSLYQFSGDGRNAKAA
jgi:hypothetical protein